MAARIVGYETALVTAYVDIVDRWENLTNDRLGKTKWSRRATQSYDV